MTWKSFIGWGKKHLNADGLSRIPDREVFCDCYEAGSELDKLLCGGCPYCMQAHRQWSRFHEEVESEPLAIRTDDPDTSDSESEDGDPTDWFSGYSFDELRQHQLKDTDIEPIISWLE